MINNGIEDILINGGYKPEKKRGKGILILIFLLFIIFVGLIVAYQYFSANTVSSKELFATSLSKTNINKLLSTNIYSSISEKCSKQDFETSSSINFTTTLNPESFQGTDISKFVINLENYNDVQNSKSYSEAIADYSDNEILRVKMFSTENEAAIYSSDISDRYVGVHFDKFNDVFETELDIEEIRNFKDADSILIDSNDKEEILKKYLTKFIADLPEENFSVKPNIVIQNENENIDVTSYTVTMSQEELKTELTKLLESLKSDEELLKKFITNKVEEPKEEVKEPEENNSNDGPVITITPSEEQPEETPGEITEEVPQEDATTETEQPVETEPTVETPPETQVQPEVPQEDETPVITINPIASIRNYATEQVVGVETTNIEELNVKEVDSSTYLAEIMLGKKADISLKELQKRIDDVIKKVKKLDGNGLTISVYASEQKTEKITITLPNENTVDLEFYSNSDTDNGIKITYLYKGNNSLFNTEENENLDPIEAAQVNGLSVEIKKIENGANTTLNGVLSFIENKQINKKITLNAKTEGTAASKEVTSDIVITLSTSDGETKAVIDNSIKFVTPTITESLTQENTTFLDELPVSEMQTTLDDLKNKITNLYNTKKSNLTFIDTNTGGTIDNTLVTVTREEAKNALITRVSNMMQEAIDKNEPFTIMNLVDLTIDGYNVSSNVTSESAVIVVDTYTFNIDTEFTLTDVE